MSWILIGIVAGSIITSGHDTEEACLGRKAILEKQRIAVTCVKAPGASGWITSGNAIMTFPDHWQQVTPN